MYTIVDISGCGFSRIPSITTSLEGKGDHWKTVGITSIYNTSLSEFWVFVNTESKDQDANFARQKHWNVDWIAVGFIC